MLVLINGMWRYARQILTIIKPNLCRNTYLSATRFSVTYNFYFRVHRIHIVEMDGGEKHIVDIFHAQKVE